MQRERWFKSSIGRRRVKEIVNEFVQTAIASAEGGRRKGL